MPSIIEKKLEFYEEKLGHIEKLKSFIENLAEQFKKEGVPVTKDCRLDMDAFSAVYPLKILEKDKKEIDEYESEWYPNIPKEQIPRKKMEKDGEQFEMLKTAIFGKFLGKEYICVRTSLYDDYKNHVDNIILEKETGNLVCALDEVGEIRGKKFEEKKEKVLRRNIYRKGASLKYGLKLEDNKLKLGKTEGVPIFYLALPKIALEEGIRNFIPSLKQKSDYEKNLFKYFIALLDSQTKSLKLEPKLSASLREHIEQFEKTLQKFK